MILSPLQAISMVALIVLLCAIVMTLIHLYLPLRTKTVAELQDQIDHLNIQDDLYYHEIGMLKHRTQRLDGITINAPVTSSDDPMALWDAIVNQAKREENQP